MFPADYINEL